MPVQKTIVVQREIDLVDLLKEVFLDESESEVIARIENGQITLEGEVAQYGWIVYQGETVVIDGRLPQMKYPTAPQIDIDQTQIYDASIDTDIGSMAVELLPSHAPIAVNNFVFLATEGFYNGSEFHRIIKGFLIQGGCPYGDGTGGPGYRFPDESVTNRYKKGTIAMANAGPDTNGSQFFIVHQDDLEIPPLYTIIGMVTEGFDVLDRIANTPVVVSNNSFSLGPFPASASPSKPLKKVEIRSIKIHGSRSQSTPQNSSQARKILKIDTGWVEIEIASELVVFTTKRRYNAALLARRLDSAATWYWVVNATSIKEQLERLRIHNDGLFEGLRLRIRRTSTEQYAEYEIQSVAQNQETGNLDALPLSSLVGPEFTTRMLGKLMAVKDKFTIGEFRSFLQSKANRSFYYSDPTDLEMAKVFNTNRRKLEGKSALSRLDTAQAEWTGGINMNNKVTWVLPESSRNDLDCRRTLSSDLLERLEILSDESVSTINDWDHPESWLPFLSLELINDLKRTKLSDIHSIKSLLAFASFKLSGFSSAGPWEPEFPQTLKSMSIYSLYELDPSRHCMSALGRLNRVGCSCIGHLSVLHPESLKSIDSIASSGWRDIYFGLNN